MNIAKMALAAGSMLAAAAVWSAEVTPEQAQTAAQNWIRTSRNPLEARFASADAVSMQTGRNDAGRAIFHAFNLEGGGFVITSGDTRLAPIIAFSDTGSYDGNAAGPLYALLKKGQSEVVAALDSVQGSSRRLRLGAAGNSSSDDSGDADSPYAEAMAEWDALLSGTGTGTAGRTPRRLGDNGAGSISDVRVPQLLKTEWAQSGFLGEAFVPVYNYYSPLGGDGYPAPCGCAATAGAQIMYYWKSPTASVDQFVRGCKVEGVSQMLTSMAGAFDWDNMFLTWKFDPYNAYANLPSEAKRKAVSKLTYNIGVALGMDYGAEGSTASDGCFNFVNAVKSLFGYKSGTCVLYYLYALDSGMSQGAEFEERKADFNNALYASLDAKMPVFMSIEGNVGGHAIVADGYGYISGRRYTHLNFGYGDEETPPDAWYCLIDETLVTYENSENYWRFTGLGFNIHPTTAGDVISGRVLNSSSSPVSGATVTLYNSANTAVKTASTDAKGIYSFRITAAGNYSVKATSGSLVSPSKSVSVAALSKGGSYGIANEGGLTGNRWGNDLTLAAAPSYALTFNPNGGKLNGSNFAEHNGTTSSHAVQVTYGKGSYSSIGTATRDSYTFKGWYTATSGGEQVYGANGVYIAGTYWNSSGQWQYNDKLTVYAQWQSKANPSYTLTFNPNGGKLNGTNFAEHNGTTSSHGVKVTYGAPSYSSIGTATKDGSKFLGWYTATSGGEQVYGANGVYIAGTYWNSSGRWQYNGAVTLYARWETRQNYTLTCNPNNGTLNGGNFASDNGTSNPHDVVVTYGAGSYNALGRAVRSGYKFLGWYTTASTGGEQVYGANGVYVVGTYWNSSGQWQYKNPLTIYARWQQETRETHTLTFNPNGGKLNGTNFGTHNGTTSTHDVTVVYGAGSYSSIGTATKTDGSKFLGWYTTASTGGEQVYSASGVYVAGTYWNSSGQWQHKGDVTVYARWQAPRQNFTLTFNPTGGKLKGGNFKDDDGTSNSHDVTVTLGAGSYSSIGTATKSGYVFKGWYSDPSAGTMVYQDNGVYYVGDYWNVKGQWQHSGNVTAYARWLANGIEHKLTCNPNGGKLKGTNFGEHNGTTSSHKVTVKTGSTAYSSLGTATREGYKFVGWYSDPTYGYQIYDANGRFVVSWCWNAAGQWVYDGDPTIYARWVKTSTLTCDPDGGKLKGSNFGADDGKATSHSVTLVKGGANYSSLGTATKDGYVFLGWYTSDDKRVYDYDGGWWCQLYNTTYWLSDGTWNYDGNLTVYAKWTQRSSYTLSCYPNGGKLKGSNFGSDNGTSNWHDVNVTVGSAAYSSLGTATRDGYRFKGWWVAQFQMQGGKLSVFPETQIFDENGKYIPGYAVGGGWYWSKSGQWLNPGDVKITAVWEKIED